MAQRKRADRPALEQDPLVDALVPDPGQGPPNATVLEGYLGKSTTEDAWRLYLTRELDRYVELTEGEILHTQPRPDDGTRVWVRRDLSLEVQRVQTAQVQAEFLGGALARARLRQAATGSAAVAFDLQAALAYAQRRTRQYSCRRCDAAPTIEDICAASEILTCDPTEPDPLF